jgi:hypothetical protein
MIIIAKTVNAIVFITVFFIYFQRFSVCKEFFRAASKKEAQVNSGIIISAARNIIFSRKAKTPEVNTDPGEEAKVAVVGIKEVLGIIVGPFDVVKTAQTGACKYTQTIFGPGKVVVANKTNRGVAGIRSSRNLEPNAKKEITC